MGDPGAREATRSRATIHIERDSTLFFGLAARRVIEPWSLLLAFFFFSLVTQEIPVQQTGVGQYEIPRGKAKRFAKEHRF